MEWFSACDWLLILNSAPPLLFGFHLSIRHFSTMEKGSQKLSTYRYNSETMCRKIKLLERNSTVFREVNHVAITLQQQQKNKQWQQFKVVL